ncbi:uncharacterized protein [Amphiura filiformis]|uniref:uncharacterized protein isoform X1 n=1 Tax=Amphiura filiformis TaxID=82378 RepID=UPI003B2219B0
MPYNSNTLPQLLKSTILNLDTCCNPSNHARAKPHNQGTNKNTLCNRTEIISPPRCFKPTVCQSNPQSLSLKPSTHYQTSAINKIYSNSMVLEQLLDCNRTDDSKLLERKLLPDQTRCATSIDNHSTTKVHKLCAAEEVKMVEVGSANNFRKIEKERLWEASCHSQANWLLCVPDDNMSILSTVTSMRQPQAIWVC